MKFIRITSTRPGFRRAGMTHPAGPVDHPADTITPEQLEMLMTEPVLVVQELEMPDVPGEPEPGDDGKEPKAGKAKADGK